MSRVVLITGGTRGIGYALAEALLRAGDTVAVTGTTEDGAVKAERQLAALGTVTAIVCDVRDPGAAELAVRTAVAKFGGLDVLVNNAGVGVGVPIAEMPHDEWNRIIGTNVTGVFNCCKAAIPHLRQRGGGWIVNISSLASKNPFAGGAAYCASKAAVNAFSEALMQELREDNIRVTYVLPGIGRDRVFRTRAWHRSGVEVVARGCGARDRRRAESPRAQPAEPRRDPAVAAAEIIGTPNGVPYDHRHRKVS